MLPRSALDNMRDSRFPDAKFVGEARIRPTACVITLTDGKYLRGGQCHMRGVLTATNRLRPGMRTVGVSLCATSLADLVGDILGRCTEEEMCGIAAGRIIATVAHNQSVRDRPMRHLPRNAVGASMPSVDKALAIPILVATTPPGPARRGATATINAVPEACESAPTMLPTRTGAGAATDEIRFRAEDEAAEGARARCDRLGGHGEPPIRCVAPPAGENSAGDSRCSNYTIGMLNLANFTPDSGDSRRIAVKCDLVIEPAL